MSKNNSLDAKESKNEATEEGENENINEQTNNNKLNNNSIINIKSIISDLSVEKIKIKIKKFEVEEYITIIKIFMSFIGEFDIYFSRDIYNLLFYR